MPSIGQRQVDLRSRVDRRDLLTIGEVARRSGLAPSALRYYEDRALITSTRTAGDRRRYQRTVLRRVAVIRAAQRVGLSLDDIGAARLAYLTGPRFDAARGILTLTAERFPSRTENRRYLIHQLETY